jgi:hypothetical protein
MPFKIIVAVLAFVIRTDATPFHERLRSLRSVNSFAEGETRCRHGSR